MRKRGGGRRRKLSRSFYRRSALEVAPDLLGCYLCHKTRRGPLSGRIVETEAYLGKADRASHASVSSPTRARIMYGPAGLAYIYLIYGMYHCLNIVTGRKGEAEAVLIRALEPACGEEQMWKNRPRAKKRGDLTSGPGKLCQALSVDMHLLEADLCGDVLFLERRDRPPAEIATSSRIGVDYAGKAASYPWRYFEKDNPFVSR